MALPLLIPVVMAGAGAIAGWKAKKETNKAKFYIGVGVGVVGVYYGIKVIRRIK